MNMQTRQSGFTLVEIADAGRAYNDGQPPATLPYGDGDVPNPGLDRAPGCWWLCACTMNVFVNC